MNRNDAYGVLNGLKAIGPISLNRLLDAFGKNSVAVLSAGECTLRAVHGISRNAVDSILRWNKYFDRKKEVDIETLSAKESSVLKSSSAGKFCCGSDWQKGRSSGL